MQLPTVKEFFLGKSSTPVAAVERPPFNPEDLGPKKVIMEWEAPSRWNVKGLSGRFSRTMLIIGVFLGLFLVIMQEFVLLILIASMVFLHQMLSKTAPGTVKVEISNHGVKYDDKLYYWYQLTKFFFLEKIPNALAIDTRDTLPDRLFIMFDAKSRTKIKDVLSEQIDFIPQEPKSSLNIAFESILDKLNLD